jgi:hypothetical protein
MWLLNHKTLIHWEVPFLIRNGFEVFTPKVTPPEREFRSATVDYRWDASLTLPPDDIAVLNSFDFYKTPWPQEICDLVNQHFDCIFFMPFGVQPREVITKFQGKMILRAFGLLENVTYTQWLLAEFGPSIFRELYLVGERFCMGQAYDNLALIESHAISDRAEYLPMGVPQSMWDVADTWVGGSGKVLFLCPNVATVPEHARQYREFKEMIGDLPYIVVGPQIEPIDDPCAVGGVTDAELLRLFQTCSVLYYPSREPRHVHYSPIEAAIIGAPVYFYDNSLFARLAGHRSTTTTAVPTPGEVAAVLRLALHGDHDTVSSLTARARSVAVQFSDPYCDEHWADFADALRGFSEQRQGGPPADDSRSSGIDSMPSREWMTVPAELPLPNGDPSLGMTFSDEALPNWIRWYEGLSTAEDWGRWTDGPTVTFVLTQPLSGEVVLCVVGGAHGDNIDAKIGISLDGTAVSDFTFVSEPWNPTECRARLSINDPIRTVELHVPHPRPTVGGHRAIGLGLQRLAIIPFETLANSTWHELSFAGNEYPVGLLFCNGLSASEGWGRWSTGRTVTLTFSAVNGPFELVVVGGAHGDILGKAITVEANGVHVGDVVYDNGPWAPERRSLWIESSLPVDEITFRVPHPPNSGDAARTIGFGLVAIAVEREQMGHASCPGMSEQGDRRRWLRSTKWSRGMRERDRPDT